MDILGFQTAVQDTINNAFKLLEERLLALEDRIAKLEKEQAAHVNTPQAHQT